MPMILHVLLAIEKLPEILRGGGTCIRWSPWTKRSECESRVLHRLGWAQRQGCATVERLAGGISTGRGAPEDKRVLSGRRVRIDKANCQPESHGWALCCSWSRE